MKLDRNTNPDGRGKYALIKLRVAGGKNTACQSLGFSTIPNEAIDYGDTPDTEFFVIRLKDKYAAAALRAYADAAMEDDPQWSYEVRMLAEQAEHHPNQKMPD